MTRLLFAAAASTAACVSLLPSSAQAQMETLDVCILTFDGRVPEDVNCAVTNVPVGIDECEMDPAITFEVTGVPTSASTLDLWRADGTSCGPTTERDGTDDTCIHLSFSEEAQSPETRVTANLRDLLECAPAQARVDREIYVFAGNSNPERGEVPFGVLGIALDTKRPAAPTAVEGGSGDTGIPVTWESAGTDLNRHHIYVIPAGESFGGAIPDGGVPADGGMTATDAGGVTDAGTTADGGATDASIPDGSVGVAHDGSFHDGDVTVVDSGGGGGGGGAGCDTSGITPGVIPEGMEPTLTVSSDQRRATIDALSLGLVPGDTAAVVVTAVDDARNESPISAPTCIEVVETISFCERVGCSDDGCSCTAVGAAHREVPFAALGFGALVVGAAWWRRRRRG